MHEITFNVIYLSFADNGSKLPYTPSVQNIRNMLFPWQTDQVRPGESYNPLFMSLVKSTSISVDEGEEKS
jgi:hypothetical protein